MSRAPTFREIGHRIHRLRSRARIGLARLGHALGVSREHMRRIEAGQKVINSEQIRIAAHVLGVSAQRLCRPVAKQGLVGFFAAKGQDAEFVKCVALIEGIAEDMLGQTKLRRSRDAREIWDRARVRFKGRHSPLILRSGEPPTGDKP